MWNGMHANAAHDYLVSLAKKEKKTLVFCWQDLRQSIDFQQTRTQATHKTFQYHASPLKNVR